MEGSDRLELGLCLLDRLAAIRLAAVESDEEEEEEERLE